MGSPRLMQEQGLCYSAVKPTGTKPPFLDQHPTVSFIPQKRGCFPHPSSPLKEYSKLETQETPPPHPAGTGGLSEPPKSLIYPPPAFPSCAAFSCCSGKGGTRQEQLWFIDLLEANTKIQRHINPVCSHCSHPQPATHSDFQH